MNLKKVVLAAVIALLVNTAAVYCSQTEEEKQLTKAIVPIYFKPQKPSPAYRDSLREFVQTKDYKYLSNLDLQDATPELLEEDFLDTIRAFIRDTERMIEGNNFEALLYSTERLKPLERDCIVSIVLEGFLQQIRLDPKWAPIDHRLRLGSCILGTPLQICCNSKEKSEPLIKCTQRILDLKANPNHETMEEIPLALAASNNRIDLINLLLEYKAIIDVQNQYGETPLHKALNTSSDKAATLLINKGASLDIANNQNNSFNLIRNIIPLHNPGKTPRQIIQENKPHLVYLLNETQLRS